MTTRIDRKFAALKADSRAALVTFVTAGDPDFETSLKILEGLPEGGRRCNRGRDAVHRSDGGRAGDPGGGAAGARVWADDGRRISRW